jgi:predicted transcriptional regulator
VERTTIVAEERVLYRLRQLADARGISFGALVREALSEKLDREQPTLTFLTHDAPGRVAGDYEPDAFRGR